MVRAATGPAFRLIAGQQRRAAPALSAAASFQATFTASPMQVLKPCPPHGGFRCAASPAIRKMGFRRTGSRATAASGRSKVGGDDVDIGTSPPTSDADHGDRIRPRRRWRRRPGRWPTRCPRSIGPRCRRRRRQHPVVDRRVQGDGGTQLPGAEQDADVRQRRRASFEAEAQAGGAPWTEPPSAPITKPAVTLRVLPEASETPTVTGAAVTAAARCRPPVECRRAAAGLMSLPCRFHR